MKLGIIALTLFLSACSSSVTQNVVSNDQETKSTAAVNNPSTEDKLICKRVKPTGTRIAEKTCLKRSVWEAARQESRAKLREVSQRSTHSNPDGR